jgi:TrmH family RNA methyltransferase
LGNPVKIALLGASPELDPLCVVLVATRNPLNIGAAARAMSNFGFSHLRVVNPYELAFREARSAVGAAELLKNAEECKSVAEAVADCTLVVGTTALQHRELQHPLRSLATAGPLIRRQLNSRSGRVALLFGSEKRGLSNEDLSHCHWLLRIPTREKHGSMNLAQAVAICLYELIRTPKAKSVPEKRATAGDLERVSTMLFDALQLSGYIKRGSEASTQDKVRRMVRRLRLEADDAELWLGMLRKMLWKLRG